MCFSLHDWAQPNAVFAYSAEKEAVYGNKIGVIQHSNIWTTKKFTLIALPKNNGKFFFSVSQLMI